MTPLLQSLLTVGVRHALTFAGAGVAVSDDHVQQIVGALIVLANLAWQAYQRHEAAKKAEGLTR